MARHPNWPLRGVLTGGVLLAIVFVAAPLWQRLLWSSSEGGSPWSFAVLEAMQTRAIWLVIVGWVAFLGACFGSFLNVMAWRLPRGRTLNGSSYCPHCNQRIAAWDNIPVLGWIALRGRCRRCRLPIAARYLYIELFTAAVFVGLFFVETFRGGANLPQFAGDRGGNSWSHFLVSPELIAASALHALWLTALITAMLIEWEGLFQPLTLHGGMAVVATCVAAAYPRVLPPESWSESGGWAGRLAAPWLGLLLGAAFGLLAAWCYGRGKSARRDATDPGYAMLYGMTGAFLGWRGLAGAAVLAVLADLLLSGVQAARRRDAGPHAACLLVGGFAFLAAWSVLAPWLQGAGPWLALALAAAGHAAAGGMLRWRADSPPRPAAAPYDQPTPASSV